MLWAGLTYLFRSKDRVNRAVRNLKRVGLRINYVLYGFITYGVLALINNKIIKYVQSWCFLNMDFVHLHWFDTS